MRRNAMSLKALINSIAKENIEKYHEQKFNKETLEAIAEADEMIKNPKKYKSYNDVYKMIEEIESVLNNSN